MAKVFLITIIGTMILGGIFLALLGHGRAAEQSVILKDGLPAEALVINATYMKGCDKWSSKRSTRFCMAVNLIKFSTQDRQQIQVQYLSEHPYNIGSKFPIIYLPTNPQMWERPDQLREHPWVVVLMGITFSIVGVGLLLKTLCCPKSFGLIHFTLGLVFALLHVVSFRRRKM